jgi:glycosyltransferase involved in cell wall biosynthesis
MRVLVATVSAPFLKGGAERLVTGLVRAVAEAGHDVDVVSAPFRFRPVREVLRSMRTWEGEDLNVLDVPADRLICLKFPTYYATHRHKVAWLLHQHRAVYDLWQHAVLGEDYDDWWPSRREIFAKDRAFLAECRQCYTISRTVSARLLHFNQVVSTPLYHPPPLAGLLEAAPAERFLLCPSRIEAHKRQELLIEALARTSQPVRVVVAGDGGGRAALEERVRARGLGHRVDIRGFVPDDELAALYARCLGVYFAPIDEDLGYVTLEAMLASKPVITCRDAGGPTEFVQADDTGLVVDPTPETIAGALDQLWDDEQSARRMGQRAREHYESLKISWPRAVETLLT